MNKMKKGKLWTNGHPDKWTFWTGVADERRIEFIENI